MVWVPVIAAGVTAAGAIGASWLANQNKKEPKVKETELERQRRHLLSDVIKSVKTGKGKYADLFNFDEDAFQKSYVEPAMARYQNQVAPAINNQFFGRSGGRNSGQQDQLIRAGVDMNQLLNEAYASQKEAVLNRKMEALGLTSGANTGQPSYSGGGYSAGQSAKIGAANYLSSDAFGKNIDAILQEYNKKPENQNATGNPYRPDDRKGFEPINA